MLGQRILRAADEAEAHSGRPNLDAVEEAEVIHEDQMDAIVPTLRAALNAASAAATAKERKASRQLLLRVSFWLVHKSPSKALEIVEEAIAELRGDEQEGAPQEKP